MADPGAERTDMAGLLHQIASHLTNLFRGELMLARAELDRTAHRVALGLGLFAGAAVIALSALNVLMAALVAVLIEMGMAPALASLVVGGGLLLLALLLALRARSLLRARALAPKRTLKNIREDGLTLKEAL